MSPVEGLAPRYRELGRLKFGEDLGDRPAQLKTWRLTSPSRDLIMAAADLWGGEAVEGQGDGFEVTTTTATLDVVLPPQDVAAGQWFELWTAGGLQRRCTGLATVEVDHDGTWTPTGPCLCDPAARECRLRTVLRVLLPQLPDLGVWRLSTGSAYAAAELPPAVDAILALSGDFAPAVLGLEERTAKRPGKAPRHYIVPTLSTRATLATLMGSRAELEGGASALPHPTAPPPAQTPQIGPPASPDGPEGPADALSAIPAPSGASESLTAAARFLAENPPPGPGASFERLIEVLDELEAVMVAAALWRPGAIDASAAKAGLHPDWRSGTLTADVRTLTIRAVMAANKALYDHPHGPTAAAQVGRTTP